MDFYDILLSKCDFELSKYVQRGKNCKKTYYMIFMFDGEHYKDETGIFKVGYNSRPNKSLDYKLFEHKSLKEIIKNNSCYHSYCPVTLPDDSYVVRDYIKNCWYTDQVIIPFHKNIIYNNGIFEKRLSFIDKLFKNSRESISA